MEAGTRQNPVQFIQGFLRRQPDGSYAQMVGEWEDGGYRGRPAESLFKRIKRGLSGTIETGSSSGRPPSLAPRVRSVPNFEVSPRTMLGAYQALTQKGGNIQCIAGCAKNVLERLPSLPRDEIRQRIPYIEWLPDSWYPNRVAARVGPSMDSQTVAIYWDHPNDASSVRAQCSCPQRPGGPCLHVLAVLAVLERSISRYGSSKDDGTQAELFFDCLDVLCDNPPEATSQEIQANPRSRLVWKIDSSQEGIDLEASEQIVNRKGKWSAGRAISLNELLRRPWLWRDTIHQAVVLGSVCRGVDEHGYSYRGSSFHDFDAYCDLAGNPFVVLKGSQKPIQIERGTLELSVSQSNGHYRLEVKAGGISLANSRSHWLPGGCLVVDPDAGRLVACSCPDDSSEKLRMLLTTRAATIPRNRVRDFFSKVPALESVLPIRLDAEIDLPTRPASVQPVVRLSPNPTGGLVTEFRVRPFEGGRLEVPGMGPSTRILSDESDVVCYRRSLEDELETMRAIVDRLGVGEDIGDDWRVQCQTPDESLDLIRRLRQLSEEDAVVEWPEGQAMRVLGTISPQGLRVELKSQRDWFGLEGGCELDGERIDLAALLASVRSGSRYVTLGPGKWALIEQGLRDHLIALADAAHSSRSGLQIGKTALPFIQQLEDLAVDVHASREWLDWVKRLEATDVLDARPNPALAAVLRDYQLHGYQWLRKLSHWGVGACLADDMGLGKTVQTLAVLLERAEKGPALVVAPTSVCHNWVEEARRFAPTLHAVLHRESDRHDVVGQLGPADVLITSYGLLRQYLDPLRERKWGTLVLDEAHFVKNAVTKTAQAVRALDADWRLALTGTPIENHLGELWSLFRAVSPGLFGSWEQFKKRFAEPIERERDEERRAALSRLIRPFVLRRRKDEVLTELPPRTDNIRFAVLSKAERKRYEEERLKSLVMLTENQKPGEDKRFQVLAALTRLRQLACHPKLVDASWKQKTSAKLDAFLELIEELQEGSHKALVFSQFVQHLGILRQALDDRDVKYLYLDGQTSPKRRKELVQAFQNGEADFFLISLKAGGTGLNLTAADYVIHMDPWWNPAVEDQASDRAHRIGQEKSVTVFRIVAKGTIEEQILSLHDQKRQLVSDVLDGTDQAAKLSTDDLVDLIRSGGQS